MDKLSRKDFLKRAGILGFSAVAATSFLASCGSEPESSNSGGATPPPPPPPTAKPKPSAADDVECTDLNKDLTEADLSTRNSLKYVPKTEKEDQNCLNCQFYQPDKFDGSCGGCQLFVNGAVNPNGWCLSWTAKQG